MRQAFAGMMWGKQFFHYDVDRWLDGDPGQPPPPIERHRGRNHLWPHLNNHDVISMPDPWEYPWYASWDLAFHCVALAHVDPAFAKDQLLLLCREWYMHPNGQIPAYEWSFDDVNPPVHAWAAMRVFEIDGCRDYDFLARMLHKLLINFTWWVNRKDAEGNNVFEGGFLGLDNIGPIDRSAPLPGGRHARAVRRHGVDGDVLPRPAGDGASRWPRHDPTYEDVATKFFEHFAYIATAMHDRGMWDEEDGFYYDIIALDTGEELPLRVRSMVGLLPLAATITLGRATLDALPGVRRSPRTGSARTSRGTRATSTSCTCSTRTRAGCCRSSTPDRLRRLLRYVLDEAEFLSPHGVRALSAHHRDHPFQLDARRHELRGRLRAGRVALVPVRRQLQLARPGVVPGELPRRRRAAPVRRVLRRRPRSSSTRPAAATSCTLDEVADDLERRLSHAVPARRRRPPAVLRRRRAAAGAIPCCATGCCSTSTSTATPAPASAPRTRRAGPASWPT